jgi:hypothetical protein
MDFQGLTRTIAHLREIVSKNNLSPEQRTLLLFVTIQRIFKETNDTASFEKMSGEIMQKVSAAHGSVDALCTDVLIPMLINTLMFKYKTVDVAKELQNSFHPPPPPAPLHIIFNVEKDKCVVCMHNTRTRMCVPCGCVCMCGTCAWSLATRWNQSKYTQRPCPLCFKQVENIVAVKQSELDRLLAPHSGLVYSDPVHGGQSIPMYASRFQNRENRATCTSDLHSLLLDLQEIAV